MPELQGILSTQSLEPCACSIASHHACRMGLDGQEGSPVQHNIIRLALSLSLSPAVYFQFPCSFALSLSLHQVVKQLVKYFCLYKVK